MKNIQKALALVLALVMSLSLMSIGAMAATEYPAKTKTLEEIPADLTGKTVILHTNDVHGAIEGYAYIPALKAELCKRGATDVIPVDAGDFSQGTVYVSSSKGASAIEMMNAAGYAVASPGNHEFDYGYDQFMENRKAAKFHVVCMNIVMNDKNVFGDCTLSTSSGLKLGFFGLDTPEAMTKTNPALIKGMYVLNNSNGRDDLYACAKVEAEGLRKEDGADLVIGLCHLGVDDESAPDGHRSIDVFAKTEGIDFIIDGHSHTVMTAGPNGEPIQSTGTAFANIGAIIIDNATKKIEDNFLIPTKVMGGEDGKTVVSELPKDETVAAAAKAIIDDIDTKYGEVFAKSEVELNGNKAPGNRTQETNNGDLITDAMLWTVLKDEGSVTVPKENVVAITNGGGIRAAIAAGDVTKKNINTVLPFGNTVAVVYVTGAELLEALEASTYSTPGAVGGYPQTAGIKFTLDTTKKYDANAETYPGSTYYGPKSIQRVTIESINGKAFDANATYAVVTNNFCAAGGDTYYAFAAAATAQFDTGIPLDEAVMDYVTTELKGVITAEKYGQPRGDQTIKIDPLAKYTDVNMDGWYVAALRYVVENKTMTGTADTEFTPDGTITRAQVMKLIANMAGTDTTPAEGEVWYAKAVKWAVENNISDGKNPDDAATREDFATMLYNYLKSQGKGFTGSWMFLLENPDAKDISVSADEAMHWMVMNKVIKGVDDAGHLTPKATTTRAQIAQMLLNLSAVK